MKSTRGRVRLTKRGEYALLTFLFAVSIVVGLTAGSWNPCAREGVACVITPGGAP